ncbi:MAG TPA: RNA-binding protein [Parafilimonas sp.]|nr:RNA-binding protein [Parafilimonas sp.]
MNIYVSNLSFHTSEEDLKDLFSKFGTVTSAKIILDRETNRPRGFAFVEMPSEEEGSNALKGLNNKEIEGRPLSVTVAREKEKTSYNRNSFDRSNKKRFF